MHYVHYCTFKYLINILYSDDFTLEKKILMDKTISRESVGLF